jgi:hypothetical protein
MKHYLVNNLIAISDIGKFENSWDNDRKSLIFSGIDKSNNSDFWGENLLRLLTGMFFGLILLEVRPKPIL